jgi:hypothetical protein
MADQKVTAKDTAAEDRKPTWPEGAGPLVEGITAASQHPAQDALITPRKRELIWPEVHDPNDTTTADVDPRASGDPIGTIQPSQP